MKIKFGEVTIRLHIIKLYSSEKNDWKIPDENNIFPWNPSHKMLTNGQRSLDLQKKNPTVNFQNM